MKRLSLKKPAQKPAQKAATKVRRVEWCPSCRAFRRRGHGPKCGAYRQRQALSRAFWAAAKDRAERMFRRLSDFGFWLDP